MLVYSLTRTLNGGLALDIGGLQPISLKKEDNKYEQAFVGRDSTT
jgi:hypothetical protein